MFKYTYLLQKLQTTCFLQKYITLPQNDKMQKSMNYLTAQREEYNL